MWFTFELAFYYAKLDICYCEMLPVAIYLRIQAFVTIMLELDYSEGI